MGELKNTTIEESYRKIILAIGEDIQREGLLRTPTRAANALMEFCQGYNFKLDEVINQAVFAEEYSGIVRVQDIDFFSLCEHHMVPFFGHVSIAYLPNGKILGLSKFARIVDMFSRKLQVQERLTREILECIVKILSPKAIKVSIEGTHLCMAMRGIKKTGTITTTSLTKGDFDQNYQLDKYLN